MGGRLERGARPHILVGRDNGDDVMLVERGDEAAGRAGFRLRVFYLKCFLLILSECFSVIIVSLSYSTDYQIVVLMLLLQHCIILLIIHP